MRTAKEVWFSVQQNASQSEPLLKSVTTAVGEFTELWATQVGVCRSFTTEQFKDKFFDSRTAVSVFRDLGFQVHYTPEYTTGHLWWKKTHPSKWIIEIPNPNMR